LNSVFLKKIDDQIYDEQGQTNPKDMRTKLVFAMPQLRYADM
jgi:hypothetical protein